MLTDEEIARIIAPHVAASVAHFKAHVDTVLAERFSHRGSGPRPFVASVLDVRPRTFTERDADRARSFDEAAASVARRYSLDPRKYEDKAKIAAIVARETPTVVPMYGTRGVRFEEACHAEATREGERDVQWLDALHALALRMFGVGLDKLSPEQRRQATMACAQQNPSLVPLYGRAASLPSDPRHVNDESDVVVRARATLESIAKQHNLDLNLYGQRTQAVLLLARQCPDAMPAYGSGRRHREVA